MQDTDTSITVTYTGQKSPLFGLAFKTGLLTFVTLGIYRFWQKTRIRKYIWSSVNAGGDTFEYTGTGLEKFLGFLVAIVFLAIYLGLIQMGLFFVGLNIMVDPDTASPEQIFAQMASIYLSFLAVLPFLIYAVYRARRYKMARTRWRGIRFGMDQGAWGYVLRVIGHGLLTIVTLGILLPRQTFYLEKYLTDRSHYGDARFDQGGKWTALYGAMKHIGIGIGLLVFGAILGFVAGNVAAVILGVVGYIWLMIGFVYYSVRSFGYLTSHKTLGDEVHFHAMPRTGTILKIIVLGGLLIALIVAAAGGVVGGIVALLFTGVDPGAFPILPFVIAALGYILLLVLMQALSLVFITQPTLAHYIDTISIQNGDALNRIRQRAAEKNVDAEGFADALDIGGAI